MKNRITGISCIILLCLLLFASCPGQIKGKAPPVARQGVLDLTNWDLSKDGPVDLAGQWEFYWQKQIPPRIFATDNPPEKTGFINLPGYWNNYPVNGRPLAGSGFATYRLTILLGQHQNSSLAFKFMDVSAAFRFYVNNRKICSAGLAGTTPSTTAPESRPMVVEFKPDADRLEIVFHISNFNHRLGGPWETIVFGQEADLRKIQEQRLMFVLFLFGGIAIMGINYLCFFILRKNEKPFLYFAICCFLVVLRLTVTGERYLLHLVPAISWEVMYKMEYLSFYLTVPAFAMFIRSLFPRQFSRYVLLVLQSAGLIFSAIVLLSPAIFFSHTVTSYYIIAMTGCVYAIYVLILSIIRKKEGALICFIGFCILAFTVLNDILYSTTIIHIGYLAPLGLLCFMLSQALILATRFSKAFTTVEWQYGELTKTNAAYKNELTERLSVEKKLKKYRDHLKDMVREQTSELTDANKRLKEEISERKRSETALQESKHLFDSFMKHLPALAFIKDLKGRYLYLNRAYRDILKSDPLDRIGRNDDELWPADVARQLKKNDQEIMSGGQVLKIVEQVKYKNQTQHHLTTKFPILQNGVPNMLGGIAIDITDRILAEQAREELETQLQRAHKMESLGLLAGGVAHDLNNVLSGIVSYPELLLMDMAEDHPLRKPILLIQKSGQQAAEIVQDLLTLARRGVTTTEVLNLNDIISDYLKSPEHEKLMLHHSGVSIEIELQTDLLNIRGSSIHLKKTVMNLVSNAAEAQPDGGRIFIVTQNQYIDRPIHGYDNVREGDYILFKVQDEGGGIAPEDLKRIFEPFYSKKVMGRSGTGLGMAVVWGAVKDHNGYINVESTEGQKTVFKLYFPVTREEIAGAGEEIPIEKYQSRGETVLVIDDVEEQREIAKNLLSRLGYQVTCAAGGEKAVEYLQHNSVDLLVLDMIMDPGIDGLDTYREILKRHPGQRAVIASGFSETRRVKDARKLGAGAYVKKPYALKSLAKAVRAELDRPCRQPGNRKTANVKQDA